MSAAKRGLARALRPLLGIAVAAALIGLGAKTYLESPGRLARLELEEAQAKESAGDDGEAMASYRRLVERRPADDDSAREAALGVTRLAAKRLAAPCTALAVEPSRLAAGAYLSLPAELRARTPPTVLVDRLDACAAEIGDRDTTAGRASLRVLDVASEVARNSADTDRVEPRRAAARRAFAAKVAESRPLLALSLLAPLTDPESIAAGKEILRRFGDGPSLWVEAASDVERWQQSARRAGRDEDARWAEAKLTEARAAHSASATVLEAGLDADIERAAEAHKEDQELRVALAAARRGRGDIKGAIDLLTALGPPGLLTATAQQLLAGAHADAGDLINADEILTALVDERLPRFQDARQAYLGAVETTEQRITSDLRFGKVPAELAQRLDAASGDAARREIMQSYIAEQISADPALTDLRAEHLHHGEVIVAAVSLGTIKLRRAADADAEDRRRLLDEAERAFLAIRSEAADDPTLHLGLGQVYLRLGKTEEGERELKGVLDRDDPRLSIAAARAYRELGLYSSARKVARGVYDTAKEERDRYKAADLLAHLAGDLDEEEAWLQKADPKDPAVALGLDRVAGERLLREGKPAEADERFRRCVEHFDRSAGTDPIAANNAATETLRRYDATGDAAHLRTAVSYLDAATKLQPESALLLGNLAAALAHLGYVTVLDRWVTTRALLLDYRDAQALASSMMDGPLAGSLLEALRKDPSYQRSLEVSRKQQVLAPRMLDAYFAQVAWLEWNGDTKGLADMLKLVELLPAGSDASEDVHRRWRSGERDESARRERAAAVSAARRRLDRVKGASRPSQAVAWLALSEALQSAAFFERDAALLDEEVSAARRARAAWPDGVTRGDLAAALFAAGFYRALDTSPALKKVWEGERRRHALPVIAYLAVAGGDAAEAASALRREPLLLESVALRKESAADRPSLLDFMMAKVAGDDELRRASMKVFDRRDVEVSHALGARLQPSDEDAQLYLKLFRSRGASY